MQCANIFCVLKVRQGQVIRLRGRLKCVANVAWQQQIEEDVLYNIYDED